MRPQNPAVNKGGTAIHSPFALIPAQRAFFMHRQVHKKSSEAPKAPATATPAKRPKAPALTRTAEGGSAAPAECSPLPKGANGEQKNHNACEAVLPPTTEIQPQPALVFSRSLCGQPGPKLSGARDFWTDAELFFRFREPFSGKKWDCLSEVCTKCEPRVSHFSEKGERERLEQPVPVLVPDSGKLRPQAAPTARRETTQLNRKEETQ